MANNADTHIESYRTTTEFGDHLGIFRKTVEAQIRRLQQGQMALHIPRPLGEARWQAGTHFHFTPELFIQVSGLSVFKFPREKIRLLGGETLLVPRGLSHNETAHNFRGEFLNLVVMFAPNGLSIHLAKAGIHKKPTARILEYFQTDMGRQVEQYLDDIVSFFNARGHQEKETDIANAVRGLFQAALATLLLVIRQFKSAGRPAEHPMVSECRQSIHIHLIEPSLSVKTLAHQLHCSADYLSHLFVTETGKRITDYIREERIALAKHQLRNPIMNIKEIAWSSGFADPNHFSRLFKRLSGETPKRFRKKFGMFIGPRPMNARVAAQNCRIIINPSGKT